MAPHRLSVAAAVTLAVVIGGAMLVASRSGWLAPAATAAEAVGPGPDFDPAEVRRLLSHGPWPPPARPDASNRVSGHAAAVALGQRLFFDTRLSANGAISCASCHVPDRGWTDGRARALGLAGLDRNTPSLLNVAQQRWFGWDGHSDSLWSQSLKPIVDPREMGVVPAQVTALLRADGALSCLYARAFGEPAGRDEERTLVHVGKALAAFLETVRSGRTAFDEFRDALARSDAGAIRRYPAGARRGARLFVGAGNCSICHVGPAFTNDEFHDVGVPFFVAPGRVDPGRHGGIAKLRADRFNLLGPHSDDAAGVSALKTRHVDLQPANFGQFKTPSLRNVALTAPYMHDGPYATLREVVRHYSELDMERIHTHGEQLLRPLRLSEADIDDLVAFLESLTDPGATSVPPPPVMAGCPG